MKSLRSLLLLAPIFLIGCRQTITVHEMEQINHERYKRHLSTISQWWYQGSNEEFDYILFWGFSTKKYKVRRGLLSLEARFEYSSQKDNWVPIHVDGRTRDFEKEREQFFLNLEKAEERRQEDELPKIRGLNQRIF